MDNSENIERLIKAFCADKNSSAQTTEQLDEKILNAALLAREESKRKQSAQTQPKIWRIAMHSKLTKLAAAAVIAVAVTIGSQFLGGTVTFAQVIKPILNARTVILDYVIGEGPDAPEMHDIVVGSKIRRTMSNMDMTMVLDLEEGRMLTLDNAGKTAAYVDIKGQVQAGTQSCLNFVRNVVSEVKSNPNAKVQDLGQKEINGQKAVGFYVKDLNIELTIWANAKTAAPIRIEFTEGKAFTVIKNIQFDVPVDESLVSMDVPAGYTLKENAAFSMQDCSEEDFVQTLGFWAEHVQGGTFPDELSTKEFMTLTPKITAAMQRLGLPENQAMQIGMRFGRATVFFQMAQHITPGIYAGKGVKYGDAATPIFWYQPKDSQTYRVIYGDLHAEDVAQENLPK